jgi:hypothetical protein
MQSRIKEIPIKMVGGSTFGRYPKINIEQTYNMIVSDDALVDYGGFKAIINTGINGKGRGEFTSLRAEKAYACVGNGIFSIDANNNYTRIATISTSNGDVFFAENEKKEIAICDKLNIYIYNYGNNTFQIASESNGVPLDFRPGYVTYQNGRFITVALSTNDSDVAQWRLGSLTNSVYFPSDSQSIGLFQSKGDMPVAAFPIPGGGNVLIVMGSTSGEIYYNVASSALFPYQRSTNSSFDYGLLNASTLDFGDNFAVWLGYNEKSAPVVMFSDGKNPQSISTDGIDYKMASLVNPKKCFGFLLKQDGHWIYQFTFYDPADNFSMIYDFKSKKFSNVSDENLNYHPAKKASYLNNQYYFVSFNDNKIYQFGSQYTTYDYGTKNKEIPRIRITPYVRDSKTNQFICRYVSFPMEMGLSHRYNSVYRIIVINGGSNYTEASVQFVCDSGYNAKAEAVIVDGVITEINITNHGQNYLSTPIIIINGDGEGAEAIAVLDNIAPRVDLSVSNDGGQTFSSSVGMFMHELAKRKNKFIYYQLGWSNEMVFQFRFWSFDRFVIRDGIAGIE